MATNGDRSLGGSSGKHSHKPPEKQRLHNIQCVEALQVLALEHVYRMPGALIERPKMTRAMYGALKRHIMRERQKKKQEQEQDEAMERLRKERELRKKKEEEDSLNLEQTKEQVLQLERKMEALKSEKHELFSQLKKVLHQEDETKKKAQLKEQNEMMAGLGQQYPHSMVQGHPVFMQGTVPGRPKYLSMHQSVPQGIKRQRSPSPPPATIYPGYGTTAGKYPPSSYPSTVKQEVYPTPQSLKRLTVGEQQGYQPQSTHVTYVTQSGHTYQQAQQQQQVTYAGSQSGGSSKYAASQSAFTSYPSHYAQHQKALPEHPGYPQGYSVQRLPQPGYMSSPHNTSSLPLQQQLEHANQKSGFSEEKKYKVQQQQMAAMPPGQQAPIMAAQISQQQNAAAAPPSGKGSIVTGYPVRTQSVTSTYQSTSAVKSIYAGPQGQRLPYTTRMW